MLCSSSRARRARCSTDTEDEQLWLVFGAPPELANTLEMSEEQLRYSYPDGPQALPPEFSEPR